MYLRATYHLIEVETGDIVRLSADALTQASYIIGQPPLSRATLVAMVKLRCIFNVERNLLNDMPYDVLFARGNHVVTTGAVFDKPVAELGPGLPYRQRLGCAHSGDDRQPCGADCVTIMESHYSVHGRTSGFALSVSGGRNDIGRNGLSVQRCD